MSDKPKALRMADELDGLCSQYDSEIAAELRRLHAENETLKKSHKESLYYAMGQASALRELNAELVEALRGIVEFVDGPVEGQRPDVWERRVNQARAALAKVEAST